MTGRSRHAGAVRRALPVIAAAVVVGALLTVVWPAIRAAPRAGLADEAAEGAASMPSEPHADQPAQLAWAPGGRRFAYVADDPSSGTAGVWIAQQDGAAAHLAVACIAPSCTRISEPAFAPDGQRLVVVESDAIGAARGRSSLVVVDLRSAARTTIARTAGGAYASPGWTPDGAAVIVQRTTYRDAITRAVRSSLVQVVSARTGRAETITPATMLARHPDVRDSDGLIVFAGEVGSHEDLYTVRRDGTGLARLTHFGATRFLDPVWQSDGRRVSVVLAGELGTNPGTRIPDRAASVAFPSGDVQLRP